MEYRGYDSAGVAVMNGSGVETRKAAGKISQLERALDGAAHRAGAVRAAHDRAEGGLAVALAELALRDRVGMKVTLPAVRGIDKRVALFGEGPSGIVLVIGPSLEPQVRALAAQHDVPVWTLGTIGGDLLEIAPVLGLPIAALIDAHRNGLARALGRVTA